ncbi:hypothetical protein BK139_12830 [Paenibacillus sp. FSL R5-0490]|nr:hypothetical protein BK139_12830 [Paenibacillus sp. FSL R5-0490]
MCDTIVNIGYFIKEQVSGIKSELIHYHLYYVNCINQLYRDNKVVFCNYFAVMKLKLKIKNKGNIFLTVEY